MKLTLDKMYYMNVIKEITVTDSILSLDENIIGCQGETFDECTTRKYLDTLINNCQCLPFQLRINDEVSWNLSSQIHASK